jgi:GNAT superfamily N-acetyltransferase
VTGTFRLEVLGAQHDRTRFPCGVAALDGYFRTQATQDACRRASSCYVAVQDETNAIAGYYTLAAGSVPLTNLPESLSKRMPRYLSVPVARVGRLVIDQSFQGRKLGAALLADAALCALRSEVAVFALVVDAKDDAAGAFHRHHGFEMYGGQPKELIVPLGYFSGAA